MVASIPASEHYQREIFALQEKLDRLDSTNFRLVYLRMSLFIVAAAGLFFGYGGNLFRIPLICTGWIAAAAFLVAIVWHEHVRVSQLRMRSDLNLFRYLQNRVQRLWDAIPGVPLVSEFESLPVADDLDVGGEASLLCLLDLTSTSAGHRTLQGWLASTPTWKEVESRQRSVAALREARDLRLHIIRTVRASSDGTEDVLGLPRWATSEPWLPKHWFAHLLSYVGPGLVIGGLTGIWITQSWDARTPINVCTGIMASGFLINVLLTVFWGSWIHDIFLQVTGRHLAVFGFADVFRSFADLPRDSGMLDHIRHAACEGSKSAIAGFERLTRLVRLANFQRDPLLYMLYLLLQLTVMWDFRILKLLEQWKSRFGSSAANWFDRLGECEALISCATLADENRDWCFPTALKSTNLCFQAESLGHPLLSSEKRIRNDIQLRQAQPLLLVTGSNMAGKSTFLRAVGLNLLLARTGSVVCAASCECQLYRLATSIRVRDNLREGVSFFMAELNRLKEVVDEAQRHCHAEGSLTTDSSTPVFFLLDEILQGTNSRERLIAVSTVIDRLLQSGATGLVSTHDLDLAADPQLSSKAQVVHFREYFKVENGREVMKFDYKMRPGPTPTTNALKLLHMVGLSTED
ncbi:MAG: hypothetical protein KDB03_19015 [Planctomycetales bacterium]|nr:hypothetical protein [Planctomycetales bacterium]